MFERSVRLYRALSAVALAALTGCATPPAPPPADDTLASRCTRAYAALDAEVDAAGVRDGAAARIDGFPALRATRFLASFAAPAPDAATFDAWLAQLLAEDSKARRYEIANLPPESTRRARTALAVEGFGALAPPPFLEGCAAALAQRAAADPQRRASLVAAVRVPDDYDDVARALGAYPLARIVAAAAIRVYEQGVVDAFAAPRDAGPRTTYAPPPAPLSPTQVRALVARGRGDPLGMPALDAAEVEQLLATFAPVLAVDELGDDDRLGRPVHADRGIGFARAPVVFGRVTHTRFAGATLVQLVYTAWFAARTSAFPGDPLAGTLDGVLWRVTLDRDGAPLVYDSIHACGCYALFVATPRVVPRPREDTLDEQALIVAALPAHDAGARVVVELASGTHYVRGVRMLDAFAPGAIRYGIADDDALRSLALPAGGTRSLYGPDGMIAGTERGERALFWPLGIRNAGAMRQWGRHATAFVGRRHFDEAFLLDRYFVRAR
jgi:hypothetical protein